MTKNILLKKIIFLPNMWISIYTKIYPR